LCRPKTIKGFRNEKVSFIFFKRLDSKSGHFGGVGSIPSTPTK